MTIITATTLHPPSCSRSRISPTSLNTSLLGNGIVLKASIEGMDTGEITGEGPIDKECSLYLSLGEEILREDFRYGRRALPLNSGEPANTGIPQ